MKPVRLTQQTYLAPGRQQKKTFSGRHFLCLSFCWQCDDTESCWTQLVLSAVLWCTCVDMLAAVNTNTAEVYLSSQSLHRCFQMSPGVAQVVETEQTESLTGQLWTCALRFLKITVCLCAHLHYWSCTFSALPTSALAPTLKMTSHVCFNLLKCSWRLKTDKLWTI